MTLAEEKLLGVLDQVKAYLYDLKEAGCSGLDCSPAVLEKMKAWGRPPALPRESLEAIRQDLGNCRRCRLCGGRRQIVFGAGPPGAKLVIVGQAPGLEEDEHGEPFVGPGGELLTNILKAISLTRAEVYLCHVVKCRPLEDRRPAEEEIRTCLPFLKRQLRAIGPAFICTLGTVATRAVLSTTQSIAMVRGQLRPLDEALVMPTYHPDFLLKNPEKKREVWEDMKALAQAMGLTLAARSK